MSKIKNAKISWLFWQSFYGIILKYLNKFLPHKIITPPIMAVFLLTYRCNSKCLMCDLPMRALQAKNPEFTTNQWKNLINQLAEMKTAGIGFTGGEPLVRNDTPELIKHAKKLGLITTLNTNGILLHKENIAKVLAAEPENINISIDGVNSETYDRVRGTPMGFIRMRQNIENLVKERNRLKKNTLITVVVCVSQYNINEIEKIANLAIKLGVDKIGFIPMHRIPDTKVYQKTKRPLSCFSKKKNLGKLFSCALAKIRTDNRIPIDNSSLYLNMFPLAFEGGYFPIKCLAGETSITIDCYGNIFKCWPYLELKQPSINIGKQKLKDIWNGKEYEKIREQTNACRICFWNCQSELSIFYK
jgi:MoaA/NifB/PqqE/SkfB family radical SAM enzyme